MAHAPARVKHFTRFKPLFTANAYGNGGAYR